MVTSAGQLFLRVSRDETIGGMLQTRATARHGNDFFDPATKKAKMKQVVR
jgi:hypothetical protein